MLGGQQVGSIGTVTAIDSVDCLVQFGVQMAMIPMAILGKSAV